MKKQIFFLFLIVLTMISFSNSIVFGNSMKNNGGVDPSWTPSVEEIARYNEKLKRVDALTKSIDSPQSDILVRNLYVGGNGEFRQPEGYAYRNYCGPASTQVAIRARTSNVPSLDDIAAREQIDPNWGVYMSNVVPTLNYYLNTNYYGIGYASGETQFGSWVQSDVLDGYALITGLRTGTMPNWSCNAFHIVTVYGYDYRNSSNKTINYVDTATSSSGYSGPYFNSVTLGTFWFWVSNNNVQAW